MDSVIINQITKTFGDNVAVSDLSLNVPKGSVYGFIGPNGSGKTTTLRMIMNILLPDSGEIQLLGDSYHSGLTDRIGYMPEERGIYSRMKIRDVLTFYGGLKNANNLKSKIDYWLDKLDLKDRADAKVETLSKGMKQKVQFITTVIAEPELIILDEPFSGLDPVNMEIIRDAILDMKNKGTTVIFSTHDMNVAEQMCNFIFMIFNGKKVLDGTLDSIQKEYGSDTIRIKTNLADDMLLGINGISKVHNLGQIQELKMTPECEPQAVLKEILSKGEIDSFDIIKPALHDIFIRIAGPEAQEVSHA